MPIDISTHYYQIAPAGVDTCLSCPLVECVHMEDAQPGDVCPIDGFTVPTPGTSFRDKVAEERRQTLLKIKALVDDMDFAGRAAIARKVNVADSTLQVWTRKGYLEVDKVLSPYARENGKDGKLLVITGVNV